ncbi:MAG TPA: hypothetical protein VGC56_00505 [Allosphingosinicella sp.]
MIELDEAAAITAAVTAQERLESYLPRILRWGMVAAAAAALLHRSSGKVTGRVLVGSLAAFLLSSLVIAVVRRLFLSPCRWLRYRRAEKILRRAVTGAGARAGLVWSWTLGSPGAAGVTARGQLLLAGRSSAFHLLRLDPEHIVDAKVERDVTLVTETRHGGSTIIGLSGQGWMGGFTTGSRSQSVTRQDEQAWAEIHYQIERNGRVCVAIIPFGADRVGAESFCALVTRLQSRVDKEGE